MLPDIANMTKEEKFLTMRNLWDNLRTEIGDTPETPEITELLEKRAARVKSGQAELLDWDAVKGSIGRR